MKTKQCFICKKVIPEENGDVCYECLNFFQWKYNKEFQEILDLHREISELDRKLRSIKSRRTK